MAANQPRNAEVLHVDRAIAEPRPGARDATVRTTRLIQPQVCRR
jgi:hypothetical protein